MPITAAVAGVWDSYNCHVTRTHTRTHGEKSEENASIGSDVKTHDDVKTSVMSYESMEGELKSTDKDTVYETIEKKNLEPLLFSPLKRKSAGSLKHGTRAGDETKGEKSEENASIGSDVKTHDDVKTSVMSYESMEGELKSTDKDTVYETIEKKNLEPLLFSPLKRKSAGSLKHGTRAGDETKGEKSEENASIGSDVKTHDDVKTSVMSYESMEGELKSTDKDTVYETIEKKNLEPLLFSPLKRKSAGSLKHGTRAGDETKGEKSEENASIGSDVKTHDDVKTSVMSYESMEGELKSTDKDTVYETIEKKNLEPLLFSPLKRKSAGSLKHGTRAGDETKGEKSEENASIGSDVKTHDDVKTSVMSYESMEGELKSTDKDTVYETIEKKNLEPLLFSPLKRKSAGSLKHGTRAGDETKKEKSRSMEHGVKSQGPAKTSGHPNRSMTSEQRFVGNDDNWSTFFKFSIKVCIKKRQLVKSRADWSKLQGRDAFGETGGTYLSVSSVYSKYKTRGGRYVVNRFRNCPSNCALLQQRIIMKYEEGPEEVEAQNNPVPAKSPHPRRRPRDKTAGHQCPICGLRYVDIMQHLKVTEMKPMAKLYMERAKDRYISRELALLRASHPQPPIVSHMDEVNGSTIEEAVRREIAARASERTTTLSNATATFTPALSLSTAMHATDSVGPGSTDCEPSTPTPQTPPPSNNSSATLSALPSPSNTEVDSVVFGATDSVSLVPSDCGPSMSPSRGSPTTVNTLSPLPLSTAASSSLASKPPRSVVRQKHRLHPRTPADGCENCQFLFAELRVTRQLLECEIERNYELKQLHSSSMRTNAMKYKRVPKYSASDAPAYVKLVNDFKGHVEGANPPRKVQENAKQRATHVFHFLHFMANSPKPNGNLLFLQDISRVRGFVANLQQRGFKPTTQRIYLMDVLAFLKYLSNMKPCGVRLGERGIKALTVELRARVRDIGRDVVGHQLLVRHKLVKAVKHAQFIEEAPKHIDAALDDLAKEPHNIRKLRLFFGLLGGFLIATTGHRKGIIINMTVKEVKTAEKTTRGCRVIRVMDDPTEDTVQSRALMMMAVSSYAKRKEEKKKERSKRAGVDYDEVVTESHQEDTREGMQDSEKKNHGNKQRVTGRVLNLRKKELSSILSYLKQMVSSSEDEGSGDWQPPKNGTEEEDSEEETSVKRRVPQLQKKRPSSTHRNRLNGTEEEDSEEEEEEEEGSVKQRVPQLRKKEFLRSASPRLMVSSSDDEGSGDWQPPKNGTEEEDSEEEEEEEEEEETSVKRRVPQLQKKWPAPTPKNRLSSELSSSEDEGSGDWQPPKNGTEEEDSEEEEEEEEEEETSVKRRVPQLQKKWPAPIPKNRLSSELSSSEDEGSGDWQPPKNGTEEEDSEEEEEEEEEEETSVKRRVPQLQKKWPAPIPKNRLSSELSSSEDEGSGDWQPPKNGIEEEDSEEEEEEEEGSVKQRVPQLRKKEFLRSASPRLMVSSSEDGGSGDWQPPKNGTEEETSVKLRVPQPQKKRPAPTPRNSLMKQAYVRPVTAKTLVQPSQNVHQKTKLCDTTEERKTCEEERMKLQEDPSEEERKTCEERERQQEEPSEEERKTCEEDRTKLQEEPSEEERKKQQEDPSEEERKTCEEKRRKLQGEPSDEERKKQQEDPSEEERKTCEEERMKLQEEPSEEERKKQQEEPSEEERKTCEEERMKLQEEPSEEERKKQQEEPSEEERKTCEEERMKLQEEPSEEERKTCEERERQQEEPSKEEKTTCEEERMKLQEEPTEEERKKQQKEPSEEERKTCEEERMKLQDEPSEEERKKASVKPRCIQLRKKRPTPTPRNSREITKKAKMAVAVQVPSQNICPKSSTPVMEMIFHQSKLFERKACSKEQVEQQVAAREEEERNICEGKREKQHEEPSEEEEKKNGEQEREKQQKEHQRQEERHGEEVTKERGCPRRKGPGGEEAVKEEGRCLRRRGQHGYKEVKAERGRPRRKGPGGEEAVEEEGMCLRRRGQHGDKEVKVERGRPRRKGPGGEEAVKEEVGCLRRRGQHGDKEVKVERGRPRRKGPGGEEAVKEEVGCLRRRGQHGDKEVKVERGRPRRKGPEKLVSDYQGHVAGANSTKKMLENAKQRPMHIIQFLRFMANSKNPKCGFTLSEELWKSLRSTVTEGTFSTTSEEDFAVLQDSIEGKIAPCKSKDVMIIIMILAWSDATVGSSAGISFVSVLPTAVSVSPCLVCLSPPRDSVAEDEEEAEAVDAGEEEVNEEADEEVSMDKALNIPTPVIERCVHIQDWQSTSDPLVTYSPQLQVYKQSLQSSFHGTRTGQLLPLNDSLSHKKYVLLSAENVKDVPALKEMNLGSGGATAAVAAWITEPLDCPLCDKMQMSLLASAGETFFKRRDELYDRMPTLENDTPLDETQRLNPAMSPESENCQPEIGLPVLSSTPQKPHLSPGVQKTSSAGQTLCSSVPISPSSGQTSSAGQTSPSSGLGHSRPLPSSPFTQNDSCNTESPLPNRGNCNCENVAARLQQLEHTGRVHFTSLDPQNGDASLSLKDLRLTDTGTYQCKVKRLPKMDIKNIFLTVMERPSKPVCYIEDEATAERDCGTYLCTVESLVGMEDCEVTLSITLPQSMSYGLKAVAAAVPTVVVVIIAAVTVICLCRRKKQNEELCSNEILEDELPHLKWHRRAQGSAQTTLIRHESMHRHLNSEDKYTDYETIEKKFVTVKYVYKMTTLNNWGVSGLDGKDDLGATPAAMFEDMEGVYDTMDLCMDTQMQQEHKVNEEKDLMPMKKDVPEINVCSPEEEEGQKTDENGPSGNFWWSKMDLGALRRLEEVLLKRQECMDGLVAQLQLFAAELVPALLFEARLTPVPALLFEARLTPVPALLFEARLTPVPALPSEAWPTPALPSMAQPTPVPVLQSVAWPTPVPVSLSVAWLMSLPLPACPLASRGAPPPPQASRRASLPASRGLSFSESESVVSEKTPVSTPS
ncbi:hypothetical protein PAMA_008906 [Pampus argenteus]